MALVPQHDEVGAHRLDEADDLVRRMADPDLVAQLDPSSAASRFDSAATDSK